MAVQCPTLKNILAEDACTENYAGLASKVFLGLKSDLKAALTLDDETATYSVPEMKEGKFLYMLECKEDNQQIEGSSLGKRKGFALTFNAVLEAVDKKTAVVARALNNLDLFIIAQDGEDYQIMYDPTRKVTFENDGIKTDTGKAASDDRQVTMAAKLSPVKYPNLFVTAPEGGFESMLDTTTTQKVSDETETTKGENDSYGA